MAEPAKKVAEQAEQRLDKVAETVREKFDEILDGRFTDQVDHGVDKGRTDTRPRKQGGPVR
ncbi:hypothetical protein GA0070609_6004 [Micromonospora echinaurantiaca]|uniref:Uncharacterized protein n=1 Tax=Micromonospora echinaurantiaca TaxID=47857 RepID=A0A1C5KA37_9ACTN|nr:hypothetical protein [Micromonospora echinaurantiaca]SCG79695.1 hypothetical protein GA0070609_6004 [Micromonospora echinaurantiaca]